MATARSSADTRTDPLAWVGASDAAIAALAFGAGSGKAAPHIMQLRHLALLPVEALELDLSDPAQRQFGDYELLELIGEGGMGVVYRARQISLDREVAVKLLAAGPWASREFIERFTHEAQNAARMQHPNIVAIHEVGSTEELHFFSMRLVRGGSLAAMLAREHKLAPARAAQLLRTIAEAVDYAHRLGVLHLDLKPANVLLDENGTPHVADFGLARRLDNTLATDNEEVSGTPSYMAPEQARLRAQKLSPATDVWGLGAIFYELVTGQPPFKAGSAQATLKLVAEGAVRRPRRYAPKLALDLEAVILKCLAKEPSGRYASARALADDLGRHIDGRAVHARPLNTAQRVVRWTRREPKLAIACALVVLALVAGLAATTQQWRRAEGNAERAEAARKFLVGVFEQANPDENKGQPFTAHQLLEKGERQLEKGLNRHPAIAADITALLGRLYIDISDFSRSETLLKRASAMLDDPRIPDDVRARVLLGTAMIENEDGAYDSALIHARRSLDLLDSATARDPEEVANAHLAVAKALVGKGDKESAEKFLQASLLHDRAALGDSQPFVADQWVQLGNVLGSVGRFDESETAFRNAIATFTAASGAASNGVAHALNELSNMLEDKGDLPGAERALDDALKIRMATVGPDHHDTIAVESNLLWLLEFEGRYEEALPKRLALLDRASRAGQLHTQDRAAVLASVGKDYRELGRFTEAIATLAQSIDLDHSLEGPRGVMSVPHLRQLGMTQMVAGDYANARINLQSAFDILREHDPPTSPTLNMIRADIGNVLRLQHRPSEALAELSAATDALVTVKDTNTSHPLALAELSEAQLDSGDVTAATKTALEALSHARKAFPQKHYELGAPLFALARAQLALGHADQAEPLLREALAVRSPPHPPADPRVLEVRIALTQALTSLRKDNEARALREEIEPLLRTSQTPYAADLRERLRTGSP